MAKTTTLYSLKRDPFYRSSSQKAIIINSGHYELIYRSSTPMAAAPPPPPPPPPNLTYWRIDSRTPEEREEDRRFYEEYINLTAALPRDAGWAALPLRRYKGFWYPEHHLPSIMAIQDTFEALPTDLFLVTAPKSGTTWLKALAFAIVNRHLYALDHHPLLHTSPHDCVPFLESLYSDQKLPRSNYSIPPPRLLACHFAYSRLPRSVVESGCRIVYLCRDPKDTLVSLWHFMERLRTGTMDPLPLDKALELFCKGISMHGPSWDQILEYWDQSRRRPDKVLFLRYEEMMGDPAGNLRRMAEFVGHPFSEEEERDGVVREIVRLCSFENLSGLETNQTGQHTTSKLTVPASAMFRRGKVGDWVNHLTPEMAMKLDRITEEKLRGSALSFPSS